MELAQEGHSLIGDGHAERAFIEKKIFNPSLKHRQRQRWKVLPGQKNGLGKRRRGESYTWSIECGQIETLDGGKWGEEGVGETIHS